MAATTATANYFISPEDGWVSVVPANATFFRIRGFPDNYVYYVGIGSSAPTGLGGVNASGTITQGGQPTASQTITIANQIFTFVASLTGAANEVLISSVNAAGTLVNLYNALTANLSLMTQVSVVQTSATVLTLYANVNGSAGNAIVLTKTASNYTVSGSGTLTSGVDPNLGYRVDCKDFWSNVAVTASNQVWVRAVNPSPQKKLRIDVYYTTSA